MDFRTVIPPLKGVNGLIRHGQPILMLGSCFTDNIGSSLRDRLFEVDVNPFGPIYNPESILRALQVLKNINEVAPDELISLNGMFHSFLFHSRYSGDNREYTAIKMNQQINRSSHTLRDCSVVIITLGTTRIFTLCKTGETVANCHKLPADKFKVRYLDYDECVSSINQIVTTIREVNPKAHIIFTVSPLRYLENGAHANQLSKSTLLLAIERSISTDENSSYFPAYEIMMDDLRDYRFYNDDMKHPTKMAVEYIYDLFAASYFDKSTNSIAREALSLTRRLSHTIMSTSDFVSELELSSREKAKLSLVQRFPELRHACDCY